ncbi:hypothetical protein MARINON1_40025 [Marinobacter salarius]|nr:hypothetical protein MBHK15_111157 [Marinobacter salarius]VXB14870.1 hypothetical protein MARINON1_40025 [Marinobacter salarius]
MPLARTVSGARHISDIPCTRSNKLWERLQCGKDLQQHTDKVATVLLPVAKIETGGDERSCTFLLFMIMAHWGGYCWSV